MNLTAFEDGDPAEQTARPSTRVPAATRPERRVEDLGVVEQAFRERPQKRVDATIAPRAALNRARVMMTSNSLPPST